jgi:hypothetical protein
MIDTDTPILLTYTGGPAFVGAFAEMMRDEGLLAEYEPPLERPGAPTPTEAVSLVIAVTGHPLMWNSLMAAVTEFREHFPSNTVEVPGEDYEY